ncbi:MAG: FtsQ-type POTRA domain-containing protein [Oscillospiraceae bacterium]|nr:FtsQ-type POTRA domain-containing protein [Oscillospiraceae bacterium]
MDEKRKRPAERGKTTVTRERPRTPGSNPKTARPRSGNAAARETARRERLAEQGTESAEARRPRAERPARAAKQAAPGREAPPKRSAAPEAARKAGRARKKKPHRVYNTNFGFKFGIMLAVVAAVVVSMIIFFKVKHIEVILPESGNGTQAYYTKEEIIEASGINLDENLLSMSKAKVASNIKTALPYVNEIQIKKQLPGTVIISFTEFEVSYAVADERGGWWLINREGRVLESADEKSVRGHLTVTGMPIKVPKDGEQIMPAAAEGADVSEIENKRTVVLELLPELEKQSYAKQIDSVDVSASYDLTLKYGTRYLIKLGTTEKLSYKLQYLQAVLEDKEIQRRSGTIDLTFNEDDKVHFLEFR